MSNSQECLTLCGAREDRSKRSRCRGPAMRRSASRTARSPVEEGSGGRTDPGPFKDMPDQVQMVEQDPGIAVHDLRADRRDLDLEHVTRLRRPVAGAVNATFPSARASEVC